jgi:hypothetical protein
VQRNTCPIPNRNNDIPPNADANDASDRQAHPYSLLFPRFHRDSLREPDSHTNTSYDERDLG